MKSNIIEEISNKNNGILRTRDVVSAGISKSYFLEYVKANNYRKLARGIYISSDAWEDGMYILQSRYNQAVFSYETSLYLLGLSEREPFNYEVTVKRGYNTKNLKEYGAVVYTVNPEWYPIGIVELKTPIGNTVRAYNAERTLCDIFKSQCKIEIQDKQFAMRQYVRQSGRNVPQLMEYAKIFRVEKAVKQYLEVLL
ncbi:MAG: abortive phage infection protein [Acutalibacteraceae bacterium]